MFRIHEKLEFKSDNSTTRTNNLPDPRIVEKVLWEFKNIHGVNFDEIDTGTWSGKRLRGELLVLLRDKAGLKYEEISEISVFSNLSFTSLRDLYRRTRKRAKEK
jgi:hypothetical protein